MSQLFDTFKARAEAVSAEVHRVSTRSAALEFVLDLLRAESGPAVWVPGSLLDGVDRVRLMNEIPGLEFEVTQDAAEKSKVGISQVEWAIANTGTLVTDAAPAERRLASALPLIHVAIAATSAIQPDLPSALARIHPSQSGYISLITGPSRTADIERVLTIGVHGPSRLVIVFVDELGEKLMSTAFKESIHAAVNNANLTGALGRFSEAYRTSRAKAYEGIDFEEVRGRIAEIKSYAAAHIDELAATFARNAEARGAKVFRARDPESVVQYIQFVARQNGVKSVVKSKSMASEEIHLNRHLEEAGISVSETDLGEWIVQLAGERPSHMVMPAIHMTKEQVADLFSKEVNERLAADIPELVKRARKELRTKFLNAEMGISGANIAVAETGSLVIVTNEGNARLVTTLPKTHVAIVGVEKLIARFDEIVPILTALPRSATAQLLTSYVSIITGPSPNPDGSLKNLHIVLMDNHRTDMSRDPAFKEALQCIRCASCLNVCPVFRLVGGHVFGKTYTGGIGTILTAWFDELKQSEEIQGLCIQCGNCVDVCPGKVPIPDMILELRRRVAKQQGTSMKEKAAFAVVNNRRLFHGMLRAASTVQKPFAKDGFIRHLPMFLSNLCEFRSLPAVAEVPFRDRFKEIRQDRAGREKVAFYAGCLIDFAYPETGQAVVKLLNKAGLEVVFPEGQTCCGAPARFSGAYETAAGNARANIEALLADDVATVVSACPTCTVALKHDFAKTFVSVGMTDQIARAQQLAAKVVDFSTLVKKLVDEGRLTPAEGNHLATITYHDSCHLKKTLRADRAPRELLAQAGYQLKEMFEADSCCGMGGSYSLKMPEISAPILRRKLVNIQNTGATVVALDCPGCAMQIRGGLDKDGSPIEVRHTAELIADRFDAGPVSSPIRGGKRL